MFVFVQFGVVCPIATSKISQRIVVLRPKGPKFFVVSAIMNPTQHQKKREQFKLRAIIGEQCFDDGEFGLLLVMSDGARSVRWVICRTPKVSRQARCAVNSASFMTAPARGQPHGYRNTGFITPIKGVLQHLCLLIIQILRGRKIGQYAQHSQAIFLRGCEVGCEQGLHSPWQYWLGDFQKLIYLSAGSNQDVPFRQDWVTFQSGFNRLHRHFGQ